MYAHWLSYFQWLHRWVSIFPPEEVAASPPEWFQHPPAWLRRMGLRRLAFAIHTEAPSRVVLELLAHRLRRPEGTIRRSLSAARRRRPGVEAEWRRQMITPAMLNDAEQVNLWQAPIPQNIDWVLWRAGSRARPPARP